MSDSQILVLNPDVPSDINPSLATISDGGAVTTIDYIGIKDGNTLNKTLTIGINPGQTNQLFSITMPSSPGGAGQVLAIDSAGVDYAVLKFANNGGGSGGGTVTQINTGSGLTGGPITTAGTIALANTAVTAGSYTLGNFTVGTDGRITAASNGSAVTSIIAGSGLTGGTITESGTIALGTTAVTAGSYTLGNFTVGTDGRITAASNGSAVTSIIAGSGLTGGTITNTGTIALANTAVTAGSYTNANLTIGADGRITAASNGSISVTSGTGTLSYIFSLGNPFASFTVTNAAITTSSNIVLQRIGEITNASTIGQLTISSQTNGSFTVKSTVQADVGQVKWFIL